MAKQMKLSFKDDLSKTESVKFESFHASEKHPLGLRIYYNYTSGNPIDFNRSEAESLRNFLTKSIKMWNRQKPKRKKSVIKKAIKTTMKKPLKGVAK